MTTDPECDDLPLMMTVEYLPQGYPLYVVTDSAAEHGTEAILGLVVGWTRPMSEVNDPGLFPVLVSLTETNPGGACIESQTFSVHLDLAEAEAALADRKRHLDELGES